MTSPAAIVDDLRDLLVAIQRGDITRAGTVVKKLEAMREKLRGGGIMAFEMPAPVDEPVRSGVVPHVAEPEAHWPSVFRRGSERDR